MYNALAYVDFNPHLRVGGDFDVTAEFIIIGISIHTSA